LRVSVALVVLSSFIIPSGIAAQTSTSDQPTLQGSSTSTAAQAPIAHSVPSFDRPVSWKLLLPNILSDQKHIWTFPVRLAHGHDWLPTVAVLGTTGGLLALDPIEANYFRRTSSFHGFNNIFNSNVTGISMVVAPASFYVVGLIRKDEKAQHTALLAGEAVADAEILTTVLKDVTKRARPSSYPPQGNLYDSWRDSKGSALSSRGGFPSGHTIVAFSIATVVARRYGNHNWVPYVAYGAATLVGFSRLSLTAHFTSDVFMGAALGYSISRFTVLRQ
jgi:membrane-associated phospholipid phosphatase